MANRLRVLAKLADLLTERSEALAEAISVEMGKLIQQSRNELKICAGIARYYAEKAPEFLKPVPYQTKLGEAWVEHHPIGVLVAVEPWNFPFYQLVRVVAPAIAVGNPILLKQAEIVPHCAELFEAPVREAGAPDGACTNLYISNAQVSDLIGDDRIQGVALTGSERAGSAVASRASEKLKKSTLELGGNDVFIVLDDADVEKAAEVGARARLANAGHVCTAAKRFLLQESIADRFLAAFSARMKGVILGNPLDPSTTLGPLSSKGARDRLESQVEAVVAKSATLLFGKAANRQGYFYEPTILTGIARDNPAFYEELFGPVAQIYVVGSDDEIVELANDSHFGLGGSIFAGDIERAKSLASRIETGMVYINTATGSMPELPFGDIKNSGFGQQLGDLGIKEFVNRKLIVVAG
ncbi:NAD-dependent succinate-semialdehyde dehydrogenase [uncultured Methylobacterium sp.]|uniref:NAD-dependent succinate-semialdehyde dehydrogenase n=1 Tax=uncultured Methylobacterium sp. TaxID=157278 RepID=UPI0035CB613B